jgi:hypothetical protein
MIEPSGKSRFKLLSTFIGLRSRRQGKSHRFSGSAYHQMHAQTVKIAPLARDMAAEGFTMFL